MNSIDISITEAINGLAGKSALLDQLFSLISAYAIPFMVVAVALQWWRTGNRPLVRHTLLAAGLSFLLGLGVNQLILLVFDRVRPYDAGITHLLIAPSADPSFPSDHATAAMAIATLFLFVKRLRVQGLVLLAAAVVVGFSRVFVGIHYASDVLGGMLIGAAAATAVWTAFKPESRVSRIFTSIL